MGNPGIQSVGPGSLHAESSVVISTTGKPRAIGRLSGALPLICASMCARGSQDRGVSDGGRNDCVLLNQNVVSFSGMGSSEGNSDTGA